MSDVYYCKDCGHLSQFKTHACSALGHRIAGSARLSAHEMVRALLHIEKECRDKMLPQADVDDALLHHLFLHFFATKISNIVKETMQ